MPNHVHLLIEPFGECGVQEIVSALKKYSAREINKVLNRKGRLWQKEYFDRIVRNETHYMKILNYIYNNPRNLPPDWYTYYLATNIHI